MELGLLSPAIALDRLTNVALNVRRKGTFAVVILVVALARVDIDQVVLDGALHATRHVVIDGGETYGHAHWLVFAKQGTTFTLHLRIAKVDAGDIEALLGFVTGEQAVETMLTKRTSRAEAGLIVVCLLCEDLFAGLWGIFLFHGCKGNHFVGDKQIILNKKSKKHYTFLHKSCIILNTKYLHNV